VDSYQHQVFRANSCLLAHLACRCLPHQIRDEKDLAGYNCSPLFSVIEHQRADMQGIVDSFLYLRRLIVPSDLKASILCWRDLDARCPGA
jgi:hypothetical protein